MTPSQKLREYLANEKTYLIPGVFECIGAKVAQSCGFEIVSVTGNGLSASFLGRPDMGFLTMAENVDCVSRICRSVAVPVIADADNGYGGVLNVTRSVEEFMAAGVAGIHIEDQPNPKKCAYYGGEKSILSLEESVKKLKAAVYARGRNPMCIIARTDAMRSHGLDEAIRRTHAYAEAGVDAVFVVGLESREEIEELVGKSQSPILVNINDGKALSEFEQADFEQMGIKGVMYPATLRNAMVYVAKRSLQEMRDKGHTRDVLGALADFEEFNDLMEIAKYQQIEEQFR
jgi:methylisocitrate lyase